MRSLLRQPNYYLKNLYFFVKYKNEWKEHKFWKQKIEKRNFYKNKKLFKIDDIDVDKILVSKKNNMPQISQLNISLERVTMMSLNHYV